MPSARIDTPAKTPPLSLVLAYGPALVILIAGVAGLFIDAVVPLGRLWAAAILIFLAGVVRGLSFFTHGGPRLSQVAVMMWRFVCGIVALILPLPLAFAVLGAGYLSSLLYDPFAARSGGAPRYFAHLRPPQMAIALAGLALLFWASVRT